MKNFKIHFPDVEFDKPNLGLTQNLCVHISLFDHWLSEVEADQCQIFSYGSALKSDVLVEYFEGESKFQILYESMSQEGVICNQSDTLQLLNFCDEKLKKIVTEILREKKLMDVYFVSDQVRVLGGYDRTDLIILDSNVDFVEFELKVNNAGLFILHR